MKNYADILFVNEVRALQEREGTAEKYDQFYPQRTKEVLDESDRSFITSRESFYIASVSSTGWPYVQHRGGPQGFLKVIGNNRLGFIDYPGNRQFITMGHAAHENRVALFLMDYERSARLKILGRLTMQRAEDADPELCEKLTTSGQARIDRVATIDVEAVDWNCPKYIPRLIAEYKVNAFLESQLKSLTEENETLKAKIAEFTETK